MRNLWYNSTCSAGVAHPVERHLAKVEVASSSLVTRSKKKRPANGWSFLFGKGEVRLEPSNATRMSVAREGWTERNLSFLRQQKTQTSLVTHITASGLVTHITASGLVTHITANEPRHPSKKIRRASSADLLRLFFGFVIFLGREDGF